MTHRRSVYIRIGALMLLFLLVLGGILPLRSEEQVVAKVLPEKTYLILNRNWFSGWDGIIYPPLLYRDIIYLPLTYNICRNLGIKLEFLPQKGLNIAADDGTIGYHPLSFERGESVWQAGDHINLEKASTPLFINGKSIDNTKESWPFLQYNEIIYLPLTWQYVVDELNLELVFEKTENDTRLNVNRFCEPMTLSKEEVANLIERAEEALWQAEWFIAVKEWMYPAGSNVRLIYRENRSSGTIWYTLENGDHYMNLQGEDYFSHEGGINMNPRGYPPPDRYGITATPPAQSDSWQKISNPPSLPQVIFSLQTLQDQAEETEVKYYGSTRFIDIQALEAGKDISDDDAWFYSIRIDFETGQCLSYYQKQIGKSVGDYISYTCDMPYIIPEP